MTRRWRAGSARGPRDLETGIEGLVGVDPLAQAAIALGERAQGAGQAIDRGDNHAVRPHLVPAHDEQRRPAQARVAAHLADQRVACALYVLLADQQHLGSTCRRRENWRSVGCMSTTTTVAPRARSS